MATSSEIYRKEILIFIECGDEIRTQEEVCNLFNAKYSNRRITRSTVSNIVKKCTETDHIQHIPNAGSHKIEENAKLLLSVGNNPHKQYFPTYCSR